MKIHASKRLKAFPEDLLTDLLEKIGFKDSGRDYYYRNGWSDPENLESLLNEKSRFPVDVSVLKKSVQKNKFIVTEFFSLEISMYDDQENPHIFYCLFSTAYDNIDFNIGFSMLRLD